ARGLRGHGICEIARRRTAHHLETKTPRGRERRRHYAVLERESREANSIIFQIKICRTELLAQAARLHKWREACWDRSLIVLREREQRAIAPKIRRACFDVFAGEDGSNGIQVVNHLK